MPAIKGLQAASEVAAAAAGDAHPVKVTPPSMQSLQPTMPVMKGLQAATEALHHDPAKVHPVFFTDTLQKVPAVKDASLASPVAFGYGYPRGGPRL